MAKCTMHVFHLLDSLNPWHQQIHRLIYVFCVYVHACACVYVCVCVCVCVCVMVCVHVHVMVCVRVCDGACIIIRKNKFLFYSSWVYFSTLKYSKRNTLQDNSALDYRGRCPCNNNTWALLDKVWTLLLYLSLLFYDQAFRNIELK